MFENKLIKNIHVITDFVVKKLNEIYFQTAHSCKIFFKKCKYFFLLFIIDN
ncbi:hypothetical protein AHAS_Ahas16G0148800 [Arachis hypogaea]